MHGGQSHWWYGEVGRSHKGNYERGQSMMVGWPLWPYGCLWALFHLLLCLDQVLLDVVLKGKLCVALSPISFFLSLKQVRMEENRWYDFQAISM